MEGAFKRTSRLAPGCALGTVEEVPSERPCVFLGKI